MTDRALPDLVGRARLDTTQLKRGAAEAKAHLAGIGGAGSSASGVLEKSFSKSTSAITGRMGLFGGEAQKVLDKVGASAFQSGNMLQTAIGGGALVAGAALAALAVKGVSVFVSMTGSVRALQRVTGATAEDASRLAGTMRLLGIDTATGEKAFFLLSKTIANTPGKLAKVGIEVERNAKGNVNLFGTLENVAAAYQKAGKGAEGNAVAAAAFGKSGAALIPLLGKTRAELEAINNTLAKRGLIFDAEQLEKGREFTVAMRQGGEAVKGLEIALGEGLVPIATHAFETFTAGIDGVNSLTQSVGGLGGIVGQTVENMTPLGGLLGFLSRGHKDAGDAAGDHAASEDDLARAEEDAAKKADEEAKALDRLLNAQVSLVDSTLGLQGAQDGLKRAQTDLTEKAAALTTATKEHGARSVEAAAAARDLAESTHGLEDAASRVAHSIADQAEQQALANGQTFSADQKTQAYKNALLDTAKSIGGPVGAALAALASQIKDLPAAKKILFEVEADAALARLEAVRKAVARLPVGTARIPILGGAVADFRMAGGPVKAHAPYVVGEARAELFVPDVDGMILPSVPRGWDNGASGGSSDPGPIAPSSSGGSGATGPVAGDVYLDGDKVGRFMGRQLRNQRTSRS